MIFPWPDSRLSPNKRIDRRSLIAIKQAAKQEAYTITLELYQRRVMAPGNLHLTLTFCPPDHRKRDLDNLYASFKTYQDGMCQALVDVDDSRFECVVLRRGDVVKGGRVIVQITDAE